MQDRKDIQYNPELVDKGWDQMQKQLDETMPVKKTDRRRWWLFLFFGLSLLGVTYMAFSNVFFLENNANNTSIDTPIIQSETPQQLPVVVPNLNESTQTVTPAQVDDAPRASLPAQSIPQNTPTTNNNFTTTKSNLSLVPEEEISTGRITNNSHLTIADILNTIADLQEEEVDITQNHSPENEVHTENHTNPIETSDSTLPITDYIATLDAQELYSATPIGGDISMESLQVLENAKPSTNKVKKLNIFAETNISGGLGTPAQMISIGAGLEKSLGKNWTIDGLLSYQRQHIGTLDIDPNQNTSIGGITLDNNSSRLIAINSDGSFSELSDILNQRIALNIHGSFRPKNTRFRLFSGLSIAYFIASVAPTSIDESALYLPPSEVSVDVYNNPISPSLDAYEAVANNGPIPSIQPTRLELAYHLGVGYAFSSKTELRANFTGLLNDWPVKNNSIGPKARLNLGLRYYFR